MEERACARGLDVGKSLACLLEEMQDASMAIQQTREIVYGDLQIDLSPSQLTHSFEFC